MREKNFQLEINGPCDNALEDTLHERYITYIDSKTVTDTNIIIEFRFIDNCCYKFLGDYSFKNDTLKFIYEVVNDVVCGCVCWYRYKLTINEPNKKFKNILIEKKHRLQTPVVH